MSSVNPLLDPANRRRMTLDVIYESCPFLFDEWPPVPSQRRWDELHQEIRQWSVLADLRVQTELMRRFDKLAEWVERESAKRAKVEVR